MKRWFVYGSIVMVCLGLGFLLFRDLNSIAQKKENKADFQQRQQRMANQQRNPIRSSSSVWEQLPQTVKRDLEEIGFRPATLASQGIGSLTLRTLSDSETSLNARKGNWILLNFWATWCPPCRFEMPSMNNLYKQFEEDSFQIIAVNLQENREQVTSFVDNMDLEFPIWMDREGTLANKFYVTGVPETWLIAPDGRTVAKINGSHDWNSDHVIETVNKLLQYDFPGEKK